MQQTRKEKKNRERTYLIHNQPNRNVIYTHTHTEHSNTVTVIIKFIFLKKSKCIYFNDRKLLTFLILEKREKNTNIYYISYSHHNSEYYANQLEASKPMAESQVLKRLDFPAYCVQVLDNGLVAIAGGGGTSKTGVGNSIELGHVNYTTVELASKSGPNSHAQFQSIHTYEPQDAIMKFISFAVDKGLPQANTMRSNAKTTSKKSKNKGSKNGIKI